MSRKGSRKPKKKALDDDKLKGMFEEIKNTELLLYKHRLASFANAWPYDRDENAVCTSQKVTQVPQYLRANACLAGRGGLLQHIVQGLQGLG